MIDGTERLSILPSYTSFEKASSNGHQNFILVLVEIEKKQQSFSWKKI